MEKKKLILSAALMSIAALILVIIIYTYNKYCTIPWPATILKGEKQEIITDGYSMELTGYLYDDYAKAGFCAFKLPCSTTEGGMNSVDGFGPDDRFQLYHVPLAYDKSKIIKDGKSINIYYQFIADTDKYHDKIYLYDGKSGKVHDVSSAKSASGKFVLEGNVESKRYRISEYHDLYISQVCAGVVSNTGGSTAAMPKELEITYKDGKTQKLITDSEINSEFIITKENSSSRSFERCMFRDLVDVSGIEYVMANGIKY